MGAADATDDEPGAPDPRNNPRPRPPSGGAEGTSPAVAGGEEFLSAGDAARLLCVSPRTVSRWADQGRLTHLVTLGGHRRFSKANILELTRRGRRDGDGMSAAWS